MASTPWLLLIAVVAAAHVSLCAARAPLHLVYVGKMLPTRVSTDRHMYIEGKAVVVMDTQASESIVRVQFSNALPRTVYEIKLHEGTCDNTASEPYLHGHTGATSVVSMVARTSSMGGATAGTQVPFMWKGKEPKSFVIMNTQGVRIACGKLAKVVSPSKIEEFVKRLTIREDVAAVVRKAPKERRETKESEGRGSEGSRDGGRNEVVRGDSAGEILTTGGTQRQVGAYGVSV